MYILFEGLKSFISSLWLVFSKNRKKEKSATMIFTQIQKEETYLSNNRVKG